MQGGSRAAEALRWVPAAIAAGFIPAAAAAHDPLRLVWFEAVVFVFFHCSLSSINVQAGESVPNAPYVSPQELSYSFLCFRLLRSCYLWCFFPLSIAAEPGAGLREPPSIPCPEMGTAGCGT